MRQQVFRRMLAQEAGADTDASAVAAAARRLCEHLARHLSSLVGDAGVAAIYSRSLHLVQRQFPGVTPGPTSNQAEGPFTHAHQFLEHQESAVATEAAVSLLTTVSGLLASFIGESLTTRLLREAWPDDFGSHTQERTS